MPPNRGGLLTSVANPSICRRQPPALPVGWPEVLRSEQGIGVGDERSRQDRLRVSVRAQRQRARGFCRGRHETCRDRDRPVRRSRTAHPRCGESLQLSRRPSHRARYPRALRPRRFSAGGCRRHSGQGQRPGRLHDPRRLHLRQSDRREAGRGRLRGPIGNVGWLGGSRFCPRPSPARLPVRQIQDAQERLGGQWRRDARFRHRLEPRRRRARGGTGALRHCRRRGTGAQSRQ